MEDEIDLRKYILLLVNHWKWIVGGAVVFALGTFVVSKWFLPPTYSANAILFIVQPQYSITFDTRFTTQNKTDLVYYGSVDQLAGADALIQEVHRVWNEEGNPALTFGEIKSMLEVVDSTSLSTIELVATSENPETAAKLVNLWANILVERTEEIYNNKATESDTLAEQFAAAETDRDLAQQALVDFQEQNEILTLQSQLTVTQRSYAQYLVTQAETRRGLQDIEALQTQISALPPDAEVSFDNDLTALLLQLKAYETDKLVLIDIDTQPITPRTVRELRTQLDQLANVLTMRETQISQELGPLQAQILEIQGKLEAFQTTEDQLRQNYRIASDTYLTLARKLEETKIASEVPTGSVRLASNAIVPEVPSGPNTLLNTLIAGALGGFLSASFILGQSIWKEMTTQPEAFPA